jgi:hypothetical protein
VSSLIGSARWSGWEGAAPPRPRVGADLGGGEADPADQQPGGRGPPVRAVVGDGDLRAVHVGRVGPVGLGQAVEQPPQRGDAFGADGELDIGEVRRAGQLTGEVPGVGAQPHPPGPRRGWQRAQRASQQPRGVAAGVLVTGHQIRRQGGRGLRPARHVRAPTALSLVVVCHTPLLAPVDLDIGGVQIDRHLIAQGRGAGRRQRGEHRGADVPHPGLHPVPLPVGEPPGQPGRGRRAQPRHRGEHLSGDIIALVVQPNQEVLPGQLRRRHPDQQLPASMAPVAGLDRPDRCIQRPDHAESVNQLGHRRHPRHARQRRVRRADPHPPPQPADITYSAHQMGVLPTSLIVPSQTPSSQVSRAPIAISRARSPIYSRNRV